MLIPEFQTGASAERGDGVSGETDAQAGFCSGSFPSLDRDIPAAVGWAGAGEEWDAATLSAVLRSWEHRFGAVLVRMGANPLGRSTRWSFWGSERQRRRSATRSSTTRSSSTARPASRIAAPRPESHTASAPAPVSARPDPVATAAR
jgi:uncharacterized protein DUF4253